MAGGGVVLGRAVCGACIQAAGWKNELRSLKRRFTASQAVGCVDWNWTNRMTMDRLYSSPRVEVTM